jgi:hypothetical protein
LDGAIVKSLIRILGVLAAFALLTVLTNLPRERRQRKLAASRAGTDAFADFRASLADIPEEVLRRVYARVQALLPGKDFPLRGADNLVNTLELDLGTLYNAVDDLIPESHLPVDLRMKTLADLANAVWAYEKS